jgi:type II secretory ATPase GspE/PulE/Tfp pilus assembly ATPase PilB-like protein
LETVAAHHSTSETPPSPDGPGPQLLEELVQRAERAQASDIHLQMHPDKAQAFFRLDGVLTPVAEFPHDVAERIFGRIKFLARLKTYQESLPQDGRIDKAALKAASDLRVATYPTVTGEKIVLRLFQNSAIRSLTELGFPAATCSAIDLVLRQTSGLLLLTGPAGSGKTTTIYSCLKQLAEPGGRHVITIEDPVEQIIPGIMQTEVNESLGLDFAKAARHLLRQDPQVLVIGEIRDEQTAVIAVRAALTGHLVISTLHAGSCQGVFERLIALSGDLSGVAASVALVLNQRLARRLCPACSGRGCADCLSTGYRGRIPMVETLRITDDLRGFIGARDLARLKTTPSLAEHAQAMLQEGLTNAAEIARVLGSA